MKKTYQLLKLVNSMHKKPIKTEFFHWVRNQDAETITQNYPPAPGQQTLTERHGKSVAGINILNIYQEIKVDKTCI